MISANSRQPGGTHYKTDYQHWDFVADCDLGYFEAQFTKYLCRHKNKNKRLDVEKSDHFLEKLIELHTSHTYPPHHGPANYVNLKRFLAAYEIEPTSLEDKAITLVSFWVSKEDLVHAREHVKGILHAYDILQSDSEGGEA